MTTEVATPPLFTFKLRSGKVINVFDNCSSAYSESMVQKVMDDLQRKYGPDCLRRKADFRYNCHGLTFISKLGCIGQIQEKKPVNILDPDALAKIDIKDDPESEVVSDILTSNYPRRICRLNTEHEFLLGSEDIKRGDITVYRRFIHGRDAINHSAIVVDFLYGSQHSTKFSSIIVLSKFGSAGEFFHQYNNINKDIYGPIVEFWTDRNA